MLTQEMNDVIAVRMDKGEELSLPCAGSARITA